MNSFTDNMLFSLFSVSFLAGVLLFFIPSKNRFLPQKTAFYLSIAVFVTTLVAFCMYYSGFRPEMFTAAIPWVPELDLKVHIGTDRFSMLLILLSAAFLPLSVIVSRNARRAAGFFYACLFFLQSALTGLFSARDLITFYFFWQFSVLPVFFLTGVWGGKGRISAAGKFFVFHAVSSLLFLLGIFYIADNVHYLTGKWLFSFDAVASAGLSATVQTTCFMLLAPAFFLRLPFFPVHTWFTGLINENKPGANIMIAGIFVPSGVFAFLKIIMILLPAGVRFFAPYMVYLCAAACIYCALMAWAVPALSRTIAYLLAVQYPLIMLCLFSFSSDTVSTSLFHMASLSISSAVLFALCGAIESRMKTPMLSDLGNLARAMPWFSVFFTMAFFSLAGVPCMSGFAGMYSMFTDIFSRFPVPAAAAFAGTALAFICCLRTVYNVLADKKKTLHEPFTDLNIYEICSVAPLAVLLLIPGLFPVFFSNAVTHDSIICMSQQEQSRGNR